MDPFTQALIGTGVSALGSYFGGRGASQPKETEIQKKKRTMIDYLMQGLQGEGPFANLFATDEAAFQKSFVDPAKQMFENQIAPQIQQSYIASGQQRGTGLDDTLTRAGVDLDQMLNQQYMDFLNQGQNQKMSAISNILGADSGVASPLSTSQKSQQGLTGYLTSDQFGKNIDNILSGFNQSFGSNREGFK